jgi:hypothetical protein
MAETTSFPPQNILPRYESMSPAEAYEVAHGEEPFRTSINAAKQMGLVALGQILEMGQGEASFTASHNYNKRGSNATQSEKSLTDAEKNKVKGWLEEGSAVLNTWLGTNSLAPPFAGGVSKKYAAVHFNRTRSNKTDRQTNYSTPDNIKSEYAFANVTELVTISRWDSPFSEINPSSNKGNEKLVRIAYETLNRHNPHFGKGNFISLILHLPESDAEEAIKMIQHNPTSMRQMADVFMQETGGEDAWSKSRPHYGQWQKANGGVSLMAVREGALTRPHRDQVVAF